jgi:membrane-associated phospholipid phosphatase
VPREVRNLLIAAVACSLALAPVVALAYWFGPTERLDGGTLHRFAEHDDGAAHAFATAVGSLGQLLPVVAIVLCLVAVGFAVGRRRQALAGAAIVLGAGVTTQVLKHLFVHVRAQAEMRGFDLPWPDSFPSGHTTAAASLAVLAVLAVPPRFRAVAAAVGTAFTAAMGFSVVLLHWHYPSDVVGGCLVVAAWTFAALAVLRALQPRRPAAPPPERRRETSSGDFAVSLR